MFILILMFIANIFTQIDHGQLNGKVISTDNKPIEGVIIRSYLLGNGQTNTDGAFSLNFKPAILTLGGNPIEKFVIYIIHPDFKPLIKIIDRNAVNLNIVLEKNDKPVLMIPDCPDKKDKKRLGENFKFNTPKGMKSKKGFDEDAGYFSIGKIENHSFKYLNGIYGPMATNGLPFDDWVINSTELTFQLWKTSYDNIVIDIKGQLTNGNYWRYLGQYGESVKYYDLPKKDAEVFDKVIDDVCTANPF